MIYKNKVFETNKKKIFFPIINRLQSKKKKINNHSPIISSVVENKNIFAFEIIIRRNNLNKIFTLIQTKGNI